MSAPQQAAPRVVPFPQAPPAPAAPRRKGERGIAWDASRKAWRAHVRVKGQLFVKRFDADTAVGKIRLWRETCRVETISAAKKAAEAAKAGGGTAAPAPGTFAEDVGKFLKGCGAMPRFDTRQRHMHAWVAALGADRVTAEIREHEIRAELARLKQTGCPVIEYRRDAAGKSIRVEVGRRAYSASELNHRRTALQRFFNVMHGKGGVNPVRDVERFREPDPAPRGLPMEIVEQILATMRPGSKTHARCFAFAWSGIPPITMQQVQPEDVNWKAETVYVKGRDKGNRSKSRVLPLMPGKGIAAMKLMMQAEAWGAPLKKNQKLKRGWGLNPAVQRACRRLKIPLIRAYDLRHSFGTEAYRLTGDLHAVGELLAHGGNGPLDAKLTRRYALGAIDPRQRAVLAAMAAAHPTDPPPAPARRARRSART